MGYETKLIIGRLGLEEENTDERYFLKMTSFDLSKCGYESEIYSITKGIQERDKNVSKYTEIKTFPVYWHKAFKIDQKNVVKTIFGENKSIKGKKEDIINLLGKDLENVEGNVQKLSKIFEEWETKIEEDNYGDNLFAIPLPIVLKALKKDNATYLLKEDDTYRPFDIAIALIESLLKAYPIREIGENKHDYNLYCVLWGH